VKQEQPQRWRSVLIRFFGAHADYSWSLTFMTIKEVSGKQWRAASLFWE